MNRTCGYNQGLLKVGGIVQIWNRTFKKYCKKIITKDSKISKRNIIKVLSIVKNCMRVVRIILTDWEKSI